MTHVHLALEVGRMGILWKMSVTPYLAQQKYPYGFRPPARMALLGIAPWSTLMVSYQLIFHAENVFGDLIM